MIICNAQREESVLNRLGFSLSTPSGPCNLASLLLSEDLIPDSPLSSSSIDNLPQGLGQESVPPPTLEGSITPEETSAISSSDAVTVQSSGLCLKLFFKGGIYVNFLLTLILNTYFIFWFLHFCEFINLQRVQRNWIQEMLLMLLPLIHPVGHSLQVSWTTLRSMSNIQCCPSLI